MLISLLLFACSEKTIEGPCDTSHLSEPPTVEFGSDEASFKEQLANQARTLDSFQITPEEVTIIYTDETGRTWQVVYTIGEQNNP